MSNEITGIKIFKDKGSIKISGSINLGYIGTFTDSQIEIDDTLEDIREWDIVRRTFKRIVRMMS